MDPRLENPPAAPGAGPGRSETKAPPEQVARLSMPMLVISASTAVVALAELAVAWLLHERQIGLLAACIAHLVLCLLVAAGAWFYRPGGRRRRASVLLAVTMPVLGPFAPVGVLMTGPLYVWFRRNSSPFEEWYLSLFPDKPHDPGRQLYEQIISGRTTGGRTESLASFSDILQLGAVEQKVAVISLMARHFKPEFAPALKMALTDKDATIRVQAATAAADIEDGFLSRGIELRRAVEAAPRDFGALMALARHHDDYAYSGLLDPDRAAEERKNALAAYSEATTIDPGDEEARIAVGRLLVRSGELEKARAWLEDLIAAGLDGGDVVIWYVETLYSLGQYDRVAKTVARFRDTLEAEAAENPAVEKVLEFWSTGDLFEAKRAAATLKLGPQRAA